MDERQGKVKCQFCGLQDDIVLRESQCHGFVIDYDKSSRGLCARGNLMSSLLNHPSRITEPMVAGERASYGFAIEKLSKLLDKKTAILLGASLTLEDTLSAINLGLEIGTDFISLAVPEDESVSYLMNRFSFNDFNESNLVIVIGDVIATNPSISRYLIEFSKSSSKKLIVIDNRRSLTSHFADFFLETKPGMTASFVKELIKWNSDEQANLEKFGIDISDEMKIVFNNNEHGIVLFTNNFGQFYQPDSLGFHAQQLAQSLGDYHSFCYLSNGSNSRGMYRLLDESKMKRLSETIDAIESGKVDKLLQLQVDITEQIPMTDLFNIKSIFQTAVLPTAITQFCNIVLPAPLLGEKRGCLLSPEEKLVDTTPDFGNNKLLAESEILSNISGSQRYNEKSKIASILKKYRQSDQNDGVYISANGRICIGFSDPAHHLDGSITRNLIDIKPSETITVQNSTENNGKKINLPIHITQHRKLFTRKFEPNILGGYND